MSGQHIGYIRVSTFEQNTDRQLEGVTLNKVFEEKLSGKDTNRPQLQAMLDYVREGDTLHVHSMDRLARNLDDLRRMVSDLTSKGVTIQFKKENLIFTGNDNPMAKLMLSVMGAFAEFKRSLLKERQKEGIEIAKKKGLFKGRKHSLNENEITEVRKRANEGEKIAALAREFKVCRATLYRYTNSQN